MITEEQLQKWQKRSDDLPERYRTWAEARIPELIAEVRRLRTALDQIALLHIHRESCWANTSRPRKLICGEDGSLRAAVAIAVQTLAGKSDRATEEP